MTEARQLTLQAIAAWARFIAQRQLDPATAQTIAELADRGRLIVDLAKIFHRLTNLRDCHRYARFVHVKPDKFGMLHEARLLCMRLCAAPRGVTLVPCITRDGPPSSPIITTMRLLQQAYAAGGTGKK